MFNSQNLKKALLLFIFLIGIGNFSSADWQTVEGNFSSTLISDCVNCKRYGKGRSPYFKKLASTSLGKSRNGTGYVYCNTDRRLWTEGDHRASECADGATPPAEWGEEDVSDIKLVRLKKSFGSKEWNFIDYSSAKGIDGNHGTIKYDLDGDNSAEYCIGDSATLFAIVYNKDGKIAENFNGDMVFYRNGGRTKIVSFKNGKYVYSLKDKPFFTITEENCKDMDYYDEYLKFGRFKSNAIQEYSVNCSEDCGGLSADKAMLPIEDWRLEVIDDNWNYIKGIPLMPHVYTSLSPANYKCAGITTYRTEAALSKGTTVSRISAYTQEEYSLAGGEGMYDEKEKICSYDVYKDYWTSNKSDFRKLLPEGAPDIGELKAAYGENTYIWKDVYFDGKEIKDIKELIPLEVMKYDVRYKFINSAHISPWGKIYFFGVDIYEYDPLNDKWNTLSYDSFPFDRAPRAAFYAKDEGAIYYVPSGLYSTRMNFYRFEVPDGFNGWDSTNIQTNVDTSGISMISFARLIKRGGSDKWDILYSAIDSNYNDKYCIGDTAKLDISIYGHDLDINEDFSGSVSLYRNGVYLKDYELKNGVYQDQEFQITKENCKKLEYRNEYVQIGDMKSNIINSYAVDCSDSCEHIDNPLENIYEKNLEKINEDWSKIWGLYLMPRVQQSFSPVYYRCGAITSRRFEAAHYRGDQIRRIFATTQEEYKLSGGEGEFNEEERYCVYNTERDNRNFYRNDFREKLPEGTPDIGELNAAFGSNTYIWDDVYYDGKEIKDIKELIPPEVMKYDVRYKYIDSAHATNFGKVYFYGSEVYEYDYENDKWAVLDYSYFPFKKKPRVAFYNPEEKAIYYIPSGLYSTRLRFYRFQIPDGFRGWSIDGESVGEDTDGFLKDNNGENNRRDDVNVPKGYPTIQDAIDKITDERQKLVVNDGIYKGEGNYDLDFDKKIISINSINGPSKTIVDCQGKGSFIDLISIKNTLNISGFMIQDCKIEGLRHKIIGNNYIYGSDVFEVTNNPKGDLMLSEVSAEGFKFSWKEVDGAKQYYITIKEKNKGRLMLNGLNEGYYCKEGEGCVYDTLNGTYEDRKFEMGKIYVIRVEAVDKAGDLSANIIKIYETEVTVNQLKSLVSTKSSLSKASPYQKYYDRIDLIVISLKDSYGEDKSKYEKTIISLNEYQSELDLSTSRGEKLNILLDYLINKIQDIY